MALSIFAPIPQYTSGVTIAAASGGNLTGSGTLYLWAQLRSRCGCNLLGNGSGSSGSVAISYTSGQKITITVGSTIVSGGEDPFELIISASLTNNQTTAKRIASLWLRTSVLVVGTTYSGQGSFISFPSVLELTENSHIELSALTVANASALPIGDNRINGMVRYQTDTGQWLRYDSQLTSWTEYSTGASAYVSDISQAAIASVQPQGYARQLQLIEAGPQQDYILEAPPYTPNGSLQSGGIYYGVANGMAFDTGSDISKSSQVAFKFLVNGANQSILFAGQVVATLRGYHNLTTRTLDTSHSGTGSPVVLGSSDSSNGLTGIALPSALPRGTVAIYQLQLQIDSSVLARAVGDGDIISAYPLVEGLLGIPFPPAIALGELVMPVGDSLLVVPSGLAKVRMMGGTCTVVDDSNSTGYLTRDRGAQDPVGIANNTAGQCICINGPFGGDIVVRSSSSEVLDTEVIRAVISTESGTYTASGWSAGVSVTGSTQSLQVDITMPSLVRTDYPDSQLAGNGDGDFTVASFTPFIRLSGTIYQLPDVTVSVVAGVSQRIFISSIGTTTVGSVPNSSADPTFGLWGYDTITPTAINLSSSLSAGTYEVAIAWKYDGSSVSRISHATADGCIPYAALTYGEIVGVDGNSGFTLTTDSYIQPAPLGSVTVSVRFSAWISVGQMIFVAGGGYYEVLAVPSDTTVLIQNRGCADNAVEGATVATNATVSPSGVPGNSAYGLYWDFDTAITQPSLSPATLRLNNANPALATALFISEFAKNNQNSSALLSSITLNSKIILRNTTNNTSLLYSVSGSIVDNGDDRTIPLSYETHSGAFADGECVFATVAIAGSNGANGSDAGRYYLFDSGTGIGAAGGEIRFNNATIASTTTLYVNSVDNSGVNLQSFWSNAVTVGSTIIVENLTRSGFAMFAVTAISGTAEQTISVTHTVSSGSFVDADTILLQFLLRGSIGATGSSGSVPGLAYLYSTTITAPPSTSQIRGNNATIANITQLYAHDVDRNALNIGPTLNTITAGSILALSDSTNNALIAYFTANSVTDNGTYVTFGVTHLAGTPTFTNSQNVTLQPIIKGSTGATGSTGPTGTAGADAGLSYLFDNAIISGSTSGQLRFNNASVASATAIYVNATDADSNNLQAFWVNAVSLNSVILIDDSTSGAIALFEITAKSGTTEQTLTVSHLSSSGTFSDNDSLRLSFQLRGSTGATGANGANGSDGVVTYGAISTNAQSVTSYTLVLADQGKIVELSNAAAISLTVPTNASVAFPVGTQILLASTGSGQVTVSGNVGVTINSSNGLKLRSQWSVATLIKRATNTWLLSGDTEV